MQSLKLKSSLVSWVAVALVSGLSACGGGGGDDTPLSLQGLAAIGAALANAPVVAKCASGPQVSGVTQADGSFSLSLDGGQTLPCMLRVTQASPEVVLHSLATQAGRVNITPLTELVLARAAGQTPTSLFESFDVAQVRETADALPQAITGLGDDLVAAGLSRPAINPLTGIFAVGDAEDQILDAIGARLLANDLTLDTLVAQSTEGRLPGLAEPEPEPDPDPGSGGGTGGGSTGGGTGASTLFGRNKMPADVALLQGLSGTVKNYGSAEPVGTDCSYSYANGTLTVSAGSTTISATFNGNAEDRVNALTGDQARMQAADGAVSNGAPSGPGGSVVKFDFTVMGGGSPRLYEIAATTNVGGTLKGLLCRAQVGQIATTIPLESFTRSTGTLNLIGTYATNWLDLTLDNITAFVGTHTGLATGGGYYRSCTPAAVGRGCAASNLSNKACSIEVRTDGIVVLTVDGKSPTSALRLNGRTLDADIGIALTSPGDASTQEFVKGYKLNLPGGGFSGSDGYIRWVDASFYAGPYAVSFREIGPTGSGDTVEYACDFKR